jgi:hypothetical protein
MEVPMIFAYTCCLVVIVGRFVEFILNVLYIQIAHFFSKPAREKKDPSYKRLSADVSIEFHNEVSEMASKRNVTLKEYIIGAVMMRLKLDKSD